jgi:hypothetical protein
MSDEKREPKAKPPKRVAVKIIETRGESSLIEWIDADKLSRRGYVETDLVYDSHVIWDTLTRALPYGLNPMLTDLHKLTECLHLRNVWTQADFQKKSHAVIRSLLEAMEVK